MSSSLAAEAAVGAVADEGNFTGRVGDLGLGFVDADVDGDEDPIFFTGGFAVDVEVAGAGFEADTERGFEVEAVGGFEIADGLLVGFLISLAALFFGCSLAGPTLGEAAFVGDAFFGGGSLAFAVSMVGVWGDGGVIFLGPSRGESAAVDKAEWGAGFFSASFGFPLIAAAAGVDFGVGLLACTSFAFPFRGAALGAFTSGLGAFVVAVVAEEFGAGFVKWGALAFFASFSSLSSKGEPFRIEPKPGVWSARAAPPDTAPAFFGSDGSIPAVSSSAVETGLLGFPFGDSSFAPSRLLMGVDVAGALSSVMSIKGFAAGAGPLEGSSLPFVFGFSIAPPFATGSASSAPSPARASLLFPTSFKPNSAAILPLGSTATKLVLTFERGLELSLVTLPAGDRPREGGDVFSPFCSNLARREATPVLGDRPDITIWRRSER